LSHRGKIHLLALGQPEELILAGEIGQRPKLGLVLIFGRCRQGKMRVAQMLASDRANVRAAPAATMVLI